MIVILLAATALRLWDLPDFPLGLHYDEAANVILTRQIASGHDRPLFIRAYTGKEVLFFYAAAPWVWMTGGAAWGLRLGAAMLGILTVAATFAATRALLRGHAHSRTAAMLAAAWIAVSFPHVLLSRYGFRAISQPLLQALTVATLWRGLRSGKRRLLVASGALLGLTGYTYLAARLFPIPLALAIGWMLVRAPRPSRSQRFRQLLLVFAAALIAFAPLGLYFLHNPGAFTTRITQVAAPTWRDALRGLWLCARALVWPGAGDAYVRFNLPGRPVLDAVSALLALAGLTGFLFPLHKNTGHPPAPLGSSARLFIITTIATMLLPSALAASEITPSNLRMVGLFPFIAILPAYGLVNLAGFLKSRLLAAGRRPSTASNRHRASGFLLCASSLLLLGAITTGLTYRRWATSAELFYAADGEMVLAAESLDALAASGTTIYIASEHYRHPTVAALADNYSEAKWLTGGSTLVLPPAGDAVYLIPRTQGPPAPWPTVLTQAWTSVPRPDPDGNPALQAHRLDAADIAALRPTEPVADFAHVVQVYDAQPMQVCHPGEPCPVLVTWAAAAPYPTLQPVVRLLHPDTGEWAREMAFHYPPEQWTPGDVILDQLILTPPVGTPPGRQYQIGVGFYNPASGEALPRLNAESFAGLETRFDTHLVIAPSPETPTEAQQAAACSGIPRQSVTLRAGLDLLGQTSPPAALRPGEALELRLCWQATTGGLPPEAVQWTLTGPQTHVLYVGSPAGGFDFSQWRDGEIVEDRYALRVPKDAAAGRYTLTLSVGDTRAVESGEIEVLAVSRIFELPDGVVGGYAVDFGESIRLRGYAVEVLPSHNTLDITFYWQALEEVSEDYVVFVHLLDQATGQVIAQVDEMPHAGDYATSLWAKGEIVIDRHTLAASDILPSGTYVLRVGFYVPESGAYLAADEAAGVTLPPFTIGP